MGKPILKTCARGHQFYKSSDCPVCPVCEIEKPPGSGFLSKLSAPARRALERAGIQNLQQLSEFSEKEILSMHGVGPSAIPKLKEALENSNLSFRS